MHRYLGIAASLVLLLWSLSGIVMVYKQYPVLDHFEKISLLENLHFDQCCELKYLSFLARDFSKASVEMLAGDPVVRLKTNDNTLLTYALNGGVFINAISEERARVIANQFIRDGQMEGEISGFQSIHSDQWTIDSQYHPHRPLYKVAVNDEFDTELYVSSYNGEIVQLTNASQRMWGYLGPVVHWIFPQILRENNILWRSVVIGLAVIGIFLTATGLVVGFKQLKVNGSGAEGESRSPYRSVHLFHHYLGLVFGVFALAWVASGLLSMNPQGLLISDSAELETQRLQQRFLAIDDMALVLGDREFQRLSNDYVRVDFSMLSGKLSMVAFTADGTQHLLDTNNYEPVSFPREALQILAKKLQPDFPVVSQQLLPQADDYYYSRHQPVEFPIYRVVLGDIQGSRYYLSPVSGEIVMKVDREARWYRWLFYGLHRLDFSAITRSEPTRNFFMLLLLAGVSGLCGTGTWLAARRVWK
ncbi:MAG: hypothetical protein V7459_12580 [Oceanicoccus sp.]